MNNQTIEQEDRRVCDELSEIGIKVNSVYELVNSSTSYVEAIPVLLAMLTQVKSETIIEGIVRALTVKEARGLAAKPLIDFFEKYETSNPHQELTKWAIGNTISFVVEKDDIDVIIALARDKKHGAARQMLPLALARINKPGTTEILVELLEDPVMTGKAIEALRKIGAVSAKDEIAKFLDHPESWVRDESKKTLDKFNQQYKE